MTHITINGRNNIPRAAEPHTSFAQALAMGAALAIFVVGGLVVMAGVA